MDGYKEVPIAECHELDIQNGNNADWIQTSPMKVHRQANLIFCGFCNYKNTGMCMLT